MKAHEFDAKVDAGEEDVVDDLDWSQAEHPNKPKRVNVDCPAWMVTRLDAEARRLGVTRQALIKMWLAERIDAATSYHPFEKGER